MKKEMEMLHDRDFLTILAIILFFMIATAGGLAEYHRSEIRRKAEIELGDQENHRQHARRQMKVADGGDESWDDDDPDPTGGKRLESATQMEEPSAAKAADGGDRLRQML